MLISMVSQYFATWKLAALSAAVFSHPKWPIWRPQWPKLAKGVSLAFLTVCSLVCHEYFYFWPFLSQRLWPKPFQNAYIQVYLAGYHIAKFYQKVSHIAGIWTCFGTKTLTYLLHTWKVWHVYCQLQVASGTAFPVAGYMNIPSFT